MSEKEFSLEFEAESRPMSKRERYGLLFDELVRAPAIILWKDWRARIGFAILFLYLLMSTVGVMLIPEPSPNQGPLYLAPFQSLQFPLGTGGLGQDILSQIVHGSPSVLIMVFSGATFTILFATVVGTLSGYKGGLTDRILMTFTDIILTIPGLPFVIVLAALIEPQNPILVGVLLAVNRWAGVARGVRAEVLSLRTEAYVEASRVLGLSTAYILLRDIVPNLMSYLAARFIGAARTIIFNSVVLYFLGVLPFNTFNWGVMMNLAYRQGALTLWSQFHWLLFPMLAIIILGVGLVLVAQSLDRVFNPRIRAKHAETTEEESPQAS